MIPCTVDCTPDTCATAHAQEFDASLPAADCARQATTVAWVMTEPGCFEQAVAVRRQGWPGSSVATLRSGKQVVVSNRDVRSAEDLDVCWKPSR